MEEAKVPEAGSASASDPQRQSYSEGFMKSFDRKALAGALPKISADENRGAAAQDEVNPLDDLDVEVGAGAAQDDKKNNQESLEERKLRLEARRDALAKKKREEEEAKTL